MLFNAAAFMLQQLNNYQNHARAFCGRAHLKKWMCHISLLDFDESIISSEESDYVGKAWDFRLAQLQTCLGRVYLSSGLTCLQFLAGAGNELAVVNAPSVLGPCNQSKPALPERRRLSFHKVRSIVRFMVHVAFTIEIIRYNVWYTPCPPGASSNSMQLSSTAAFSYC